MSRGPSRPMKWSRKRHAYFRVSDKRYTRLEALNVTIIVVRLCCLVTHEHGDSRHHRRRMLHGFFNSQQVSVEQVEARAVLLILPIKYSQRGKINLRIMPCEQHIGPEVRSRDSAFFGRPHGTQNTSTVVCIGVINVSHESSLSIKPHRDQRIHGTMVSGAKRSMAR